MMNKCKYIVIFSYVTKYPCIATVYKNYKCSQLTEATLSKKVTGGDAMSSELSYMLIYCRGHIVYFSFVTITD